MLKVINIVIFSLMLSFIFSCSSNKVKEVKKKLDPKNKTELEVVFEKMNTEEGEIFAPETYQNAMKVHDEFKNENKGNISDVINNFKMVIAVSLKVKEKIPNLIKARSSALKVGAKKGIKEFDTAEEDLRDLTENLEAGEELDIDQSKSLEKDYRFVELIMIKKNYLGQAKILINECKAMQGLDIAPKTMKDAETFYKEVNEFIERDRYNHKEIEPRSKETLFMAQRALNIILNIKKSSVENPEDTILRFERNLYDIAIGLDIGDIRNKSFIEQKMEIVAYIKSLYKVGQSINSEKVKISGELNKMKEVVTELSKKEKIRNLIDSVEHDFNLSEAEVYKQDDRVIIRLTGLVFPPGRFDLNDAHKNILIRVGEVVKKLGKSVVIIEGHTDSSGNEKNNQILSEKRSNEVKDYLITSGYLKEELSSSVGFGDTRPISSNKHVQGRAKNRRVDLVITPLDY